MKTITPAKLPRWLRDFVPLALWMGLIFYLSHQPTLVEIESESGSKLFYKTAHILAYSALMWLWWRVLSPQRLVSWPLLLGAMTLTVLYGISDEYHQTFIPGRFGRLADVLFDTGGALLMLILLRLWPWLRHFPENIALWPETGRRVIEVEKSS